jgi:hypothetical protein
MYSIWRSCERLSIRPPGVKESFEDNSNDTIANIIAYGQVREMEDAELQNYWAANQV